jgi:preprotein translocase subunit SecG
MELLILILHILAAIAICGLVLLQHGKGADVGAAFGSGASGSVFGASGSANFLSRATATLALVFFLTSLALTYVSSRKTDTRGIMGDQPTPVQSIPGQAPGQGVPATGPAPAAPGPAATGDGGRAQDIPK